LKGGDNKQDSYFWLRLNIAIMIRNKMIIPKIDAPNKSDFAIHCSIQIRNKKISFETESEIYFDDFRLALFSRTKALYSSARAFSCPLVFSYFSAR
jgi:hypothetical protein